MTKEEEEVMDTGTRLVFPDPGVREEDWVVSSSLRRKGVLSTRFQNDAQWLSKPKAIRNPSVTLL